jgi:hypothetical protein
MNIRRYTNTVPTQQRPTRIFQHTAATVYVRRKGTSMCAQFQYIYLTPDHIPCSETSATSALNKFGFEQSPGDRGIWIRPPSETTNVSLLYSFQTTSEAHPAPYPMWTGDYFPVGKAAKNKTDHSYPSNEKVKNEWRYTSLIKHRNNFALTDLSYWLTNAGGSILLTRNGPSNYVALVR